MSVKNKQTILRDPVHNHVVVEDQLIIDLINSCEVQRLRRIKQLGTSSYTFHGAEHSRFSHSVGVYEIARQIIANFALNYPKDNENPGGFDSNERLVALSAALLHDVGHGAYSHTFEKIFDTNHEKITRSIILSPETEVNRILRDYDSNLPSKVAAVIDHSYPNQQVVSIISSQIDADRMDYLLRDAYMTGANYGKFDLSRILRVMRPYKSGIAFSYDGMHAVEDFLVSRYQMYQQVYFHPISRSMEIILQKLLLRANEIYQVSPEFFQKMPYLLPFLNKNITLADYLKMDDGVLNTYISYMLDADDQILRQLASRFLNRKPLKSIIIDSQNEKQIPELKRLVKDAGFDVKYFTAENDSFDIPYDVYSPGKSNNKIQIEILSNQGKLHELSTLSPLIQAVTNKFSGDRRFFFPKEMITQNPNDIFNGIYQQFKQKSGYPLD